ncbi:MAG TPA: cytochrome c peroxidase [Bacteroidia bacterium]
MLKIRNTVLELVVIAIITLSLFPSFSGADKSSVNDSVNNYVQSNVSGMLDQLDSIEHEFSSKKTDSAKVIGYYKEARRLFKKTEFYIEYQFPFYSKYFINGALVNKAEFEYGYKTFTPHGFQVLETLFYDGQQDRSYDLTYELSLLKQSLQYVKKNSKSKIFTGAHLIDMYRFELVRIASLYLSGYDSPSAQENVSETIQILNGMKEVLVVNFQEKAISSIKLLNGSISYLDAHRNYDSFDRLYFYVNHIKPLYEDLYNLYPNEAVSEKMSFAINIRAKEFYGNNWINKQYFSIVLKDSSLHAKQAELGKLLFFDPILSGNNQRACASCHSAQHAFGSNIDFNADFGKNEKLKRNTPPLVNAFLQKSFFHDGRSLQLEDQASNVLENHKEMFGAPDVITNRLKQSPGYKSYFNEAFKNTEDTNITYYAILKSLSEFERTLLSLNSRFDKYLRGDKTQLTKNEIQGYNLFAGKALCGSCHFFPLFNGMVPPFYSDNEFEVIGVPASKNGKTCDPDSGRYHITKNLIHLFSFKTPGVRNSQVTAPYMHNGVFTTLDEVLDFYNKGGGAGLGMNIANQTLPFDSLQLSNKELGYIKAFLLSLSDNGATVKAPVSLPKVNLKGFETRKVGGNY